MSGIDPFENVAAPTSCRQVDDTLKLLTFADGFSFYTHSSELEAALIYHEVFVEQKYLGERLSLEGGGTVIDAGANVGVFTLFCKLKHPGAVVHAFEPIKSTYNVLAKNVALHGLEGVHLHNCALGDEDGAERTLTFYPNAPGNTTAHPESKRALERLLGQSIGAERAGDLFRSPTSCAARVRTLSAVVEAEQIGAIDFLKIDVEGDELAVLQGLSDHHLGAVRQIAAEVHNELLRLKVQALLSKKNFDVFLDAWPPASADAGPAPAAGEDRAAPPAKGYRSRNLYAVRR
jgi:FkbM family methyltransferase